MRPRRLLPSLMLFVLVLGAPTAALAQLATSEPLGLAPGARARLAQAAEDARLAPWQRDLMLRLARTGATTALDPSTADAAAQPALAPGGADGVWGATAVHPSARDRHSAIYDPVRERMVIFGGDSYGSTYFNEVWALSLAGAPAWTQLTPTGTPPSARSGHSAVYDPVRDRMVIFGGDDGSVWSNEVWALSLAGTPAWMQLVPTGTRPSGRSGHSAIYDPVRDRIVIFAGYTTSSYVNEVWALSLAGTPAWTQLAPAGTPPSTRFGHSAIYDPLRDRMAVFGGYLSGGQVANDVWALSLAGSPGWTQLTPGGTPPSVRSDHSAAYDPLRDRMVVFAGGSFLNDVWALSLAGTPAWTQLTPAGTAPSGRDDHSAIYDPVHDRMVIFAGIGATYSALDDAWALSLADTPGWTLLGPPMPRYSHSAIYDPVRDRMVVFGGYGNSSPWYLNDVWALPLAGAPGWTLLAPTGTPPSARAYHTAIYDPVRNRMVLFGGYNGSYLNDAWALSLEDTPAWTQLTPAGAPPSGRCNHTAIYDPVRERMVIFGGGNSSGRFNEVWALSLGDTPAWTQLTPSGTPPSARSAPAAIYDPVRDRMVVFGGYSGSSLNDTWSLLLAEPPAWTQLAPTGTPPNARYYHSAIYDPLRDRMVVFSGYSNHAFTNDTWSMSLAEPPTWTQLTPTGTRPAARDAHSAIYDPVRDHMLVFGGSMGSPNYLNDVPVLAWDWSVPVQLSLLSAQADPDRVRLTWYAAGGADVVATVYRRAPEEDWVALGLVSPDGTGRMVYEDRAVSPGVRYGYRLGVMDQGQVIFAGETWVEVPRLAELALRGVRPNPATTALAVTFSLPDAAPARLEAFDLTGRRVAAREVGPLGGGSHEVALGEGRALAPGVYLLRLTRGARVLKARAVIVR
jgi:hypothetical protein